MTLAVKFVSLLALALVAPALNGCSGGSEESDIIRPGPVSAFRLEAMGRAHSIDMGIAALEEKRAGADSTTGAAFQQIINELLETRGTLQEGLGSLDTLTTTQFTVVTDSLSTQLEFLERRVDGAVFEFARNIQSLSEAVRERLAAFYITIEEVRADADSSLDAELSLLAKRGNAIADSVNAASDDNLDSMRRTAVGELRFLRTTLDSLRSVADATKALEDSTVTN